LVVRVKLIYNDCAYPLNSNIIRIERGEVFFWTV
jgi:hypothetical protein